MDFIPKSLILIEPTNFKVNAETIKDNPYMKQVSLGDQTSLDLKVKSEHKNYQNALSQAGVDFKVYKQIHPDAYDSIFACDWFACFKNVDFPEGLVVIFPMKAASRKLEKNYQLINDLKADFKVVEDLSFYEEKNLALESLGVMSIDFYNKIIYFNRSERADLKVAEDFLSILNRHSSKANYRLREIVSLDPLTGNQCFHTGLYLVFLDKFALICKDYVKDKEDARRLIFEFSRAYDYKYEVIEFSIEETTHMCLNIVEVILKDNSPGLIVSKMAYDGFSQKTYDKLKENFKIIVVDMDVINSCAGGSLRCLSNLVF